MEIILISGHNIKNMAWTYIEKPKTLMQNYT
jgi:hypothetical protein